MQCTETDFSLFPNTWLQNPIRFLKAAKKATICEDVSLNLNETSNSIVVKMFMLLNMNSCTILKQI